MSIKVMTMVYETRLGGATIKAVALKLADYANDAGGNIWPALDTVAAQTEVSKSSVQRSIRTLIEDEYLEVEREGGKGPGSTTRYRFILTKLASAPKVSEGGQNDHDGQGDHLNEGAKVVTDDEKGGQGDHRTINRTIKEERESTLENSASLLETDWGLPDAWRAWATKESPEHGHMVDSEARKFKAHFLSKPKADWESEWQKWFLRTCERPPAPVGTSAAGISAGHTVRDTGENMKDYTARMIREGKFKPVRAA